MTDWSFLWNRYLKNQRIINGYRYQFEPWGGGQVNEKYLEPVILEQGDTFVDVGANAGGWTIPASRYYRRVVAFEPSPWVVQALHRNVRKNRLMNVEILPFAVGEGTGEKTLYLYQKNGQDSFLKEHIGKTATDESVQVKVVALDNYKLEPTVLKIDTEGWELNVVKGAMQTILGSHPRLAIETHDQRDSIIIERMLPSYHWTHIEKPDQTILIGH